MSLTGSGRPEPTIPSRSGAPGASRSLEFSAWATVPGVLLSLNTKIMIFSRTCLAATVASVLVLTVGCGDGKSGSSAASASAPAAAPAAAAPKPAAIVYPADQIAMMDIVMKAQVDGAKVANDMQLGGVKATRDSSLCSTLKSTVAENWVGKIQTVDSNSDGKGVLAVSIAPDVLVKTWNNALSDIMAQTLIEPGTPLFTTASTMKRGDLVTFSGFFIKGKEGDCLSEGSMRLKGKVLEPEFIFRFDNIAPYAAQQAAAAQAPAPAPALAPVAQPAVAVAAPASSIEQPPQTAPVAAAVVVAAAPAATPAIAPAVAEPVAASLDATAAMAAAEKPPAVKPSFDCAKAGTLIEELICKDPKLSALDAKMGSTYRAARTTSADEASLRAAQLSWLKNERNKCATGKCLSDAYESRLLALGQ